MTTHLFPTDLVQRLPPIPIFLPAWQPHLLSGPSGVGKTAFCAWMMQRLLDGLPLFGHPTNKLPWIGQIITDREREDTLQWYEVAGWPEIPTYSAIDDPAFDFFALRHPLTALKKLNLLVDRLKIPPNSLLILDPISAWAGGDMNRYDRVMPAMGALSQLCLQRRITILGLAHTGKQKGDPKETYTRAQDKILGSMALLGSSGTQLALEGPEQTNIADQYRFTWVPHHAAGEAHFLTRDLATGLFIPLEEQEITTTALDAEHTRLLALIQLLPETGAVPVATWFEQAQPVLTPLSRATFFRLVKRALELGLIARAGHGQYQKRQTN